MTLQLDSKICASCGRRFTWRKKWEQNWSAVRYCSTGCRRHGVRSLDLALERSIIELLAERPRGASICPSEAARRVGADDWRPLMERTRRAARRLVADGRVVVMQHGRIVDASDARGPIRISKAA
ncbi:MAG: DUF2256 and DUF3253 domain-containing protein [Acidimicrobiia bacterium]|nr:DUF2256 and DUF3253 domain-containing protein [Acidimicrobiia bacterium]